MPLYDHFVVIGSKITVKASHADESPMVVTLALKDNGTLETSAQDYIEGRNVTYAVLPNQEKLSLTMGYSPKKFFSVSNPTDEKELQGTISSSPAENAFYHISVSAPDGTDAGGVTVTALIEYIVKFVEPKQPTSS